MSSVGPNFPSTGANDATLGTVAWSNPGNIVADDGSLATAAVNNSVTEYVKGTGFGFAVTGGVSITGILLEVKWNGSDATGFMVENSVKLVKGGVIGGSDKSTGAIPPAASPSLAYRSYGGSTDLWGQTWTSTDINASTFGAVFSAKSTKNGSLGVDDFRITVFFTNPVTVPMGTSASTSAASSQVTAATFVAPDVSASLSTTSDIRVSSTLQTASSISTSTASLALTVPTQIVPDPSASTSTAALTVGFPGSVSTDPSNSVSTTSMALGAPISISLAPSQSVSANSGGIVTVVFLPLDPSNSTSTATLVPDAKHRAYLLRGPTRLPPHDRRPDRAGWAPRRNNTTFTSKF